MKSEKKKKKFIVTVMRTEPHYASVIVEAGNARQAEIAALEKAGGLNFNLGSSVNAEYKAIMPVRLRE
jgi:hypothetical protein